MNIAINVEKFAKIKKASIEIEDLIVFVGENNSGKTFLMMLIYAVLSEIKRMTSPGRVPLEVSVDRITPTENGFKINSLWVKEWEKAFNLFLEENKEKIIEYYFKSPISIGKLALEITIDNDDEYIFIRKNEYYSLYYNKVEPNSEMDSLIYLPPRNDDEEERKLIGNALIMNLFSLSRFYPMDSIYLPASRTGLQLLHKYFFSEKDRMLTTNVPWIKDNRYIPALGLTIPVYEYLQFLLTYNTRKTIDMRNGDLLNFVYHNLLGGALDFRFGEEAYIPDTSVENRIPLYLASSMINEITPLVKIINGESSFKYIFYDEIETCLHPLKQGQMARTIVRMVNSGWKMIVSTHSDTMASRFNNLFMIAHKEESDKQKVINKLGYDQLDVLNKVVKVYEFKSFSDYSIIEELKYCNPSVGYDFDLFSKNINQLYDETEMIIN